MQLEEFDRLLTGRYAKAEYPALEDQLCRWSSSRPLDGVKVLDATPIFHNTLLKYRALLVAGAQLTVGVSDLLPNDPHVVAALKQIGIPLQKADDHTAAPFDLVLDCAGAFAATDARIGYVELTRSGVSVYQHCTRPVFMADSGRIKQIETCLGTGESLFRAMEQLGYAEWSGRKLVIFGSGKVGTGIILQGYRRGASVYVVTDPTTITPQAKPCITAVADYRDKSAVASLLNGAYAVVTATGVRHALEGLIPAAELIASGALLANMGVEDEYGPSIPAERVLEQKATLNFILDEPTRVRYIDATMALHNEGAFYLASHPEVQGIINPPCEIENYLLEVTRRHGMINPELDLLYKAENPAGNQ